MRKSTLALAATPFLVVALASCSSSTSGSGGSSAPPEVPPSEIANTENEAKVDAFCDQVDAVLAEAKKLTEDAQKADGPTGTMTKEQTAKIKAEVKKLSDQAKALAPVVIAEPQLTEKVTECATNLQDASFGG